jgi:hypothetical protein
MSFFTSVKVTDGTNIAAVKPASTAAVAADPALVVAISPNNTVAVTQSTSPWVVSLTSTTITGTVGVTQSTSPWVVDGNLTHNSAAPTATNIGVLPAIASSAAPIYNTGDQVLLSTDLSGNIRAVIPGTVSVVPGLPTTGATTRTNTTTSSSGWTSLVAGSGSTTIRLWRMIVSVNEATNVSLGDGTTIFEGPYYLQAGGSIVLDISGEPWYVGASGAALEINSSNAVSLTATTWTTQS